MTQTKSITSVKELQEVANDFLKENFNLTLDIPIRVSNRMTRTMGRFVRTQNRITKEITPKEIVISGNVIKYYSTHELIDTLKHECVHYALYTLGKPFADGEAYFENTLNKLSVSSTMTTQYKGKAHKYRCLDCKNEFRQTRRFNTSKYRCSRCKGTLDYVCEVLIK